MDVVVPTHKDEAEKSYEAGREVGVEGGLSEGERWRGKAGEKAEEEEEREQEEEIGDEETEVWNRYTGEAAKTSHCFSMPDPFRD